MCIFFLFFQLWIYTHTIIHYNFYFNYINSFLIWQPQIKITIVLVLLLLLYAWNTNCICIITNKKNNKKHISSAESRFMIFGSASGFQLNEYFYYYYYWYNCRNTIIYTWRQKRKRVIIMKKRTKEIKKFYILIE